jgi:methanogenic corrinoid protein MtbC1
VAERTEGGHRLYSDDQVARVRWVKAQIDAGLSAGRAARAALALDRAGFGASVATAAHPRPSSTAAIDHTFEAGDDPHATLSMRLESCLLQGDLVAADELLLSAVAVTDLAVLITRVVGPTLDAVGRAWRAGTVDVATEHLATAYLHHKIVGWLTALPAVNGMGPVVLACPPGERHDGGLLMFAALLKRSGIPVAFLGQSTPFADLETFALGADASAIVLTSMLESTATTIANWPEEMPTVAEQSSPLVGFAGGAFRDQPRLREGIEGHYLGDDLQSGVIRLSSLLGRQPLPVLTSLVSF